MHEWMPTRNFDDDYVALACNMFALSSLEISSLIVLTQHIRTSQPPGSISPRIKTLALYFAVAQV